jgi:hypothetical protein
MNCTYKECDGELISDNMDARQEWSDESFHCDKCEKDFTLTTIYKTQSSIIDTQKLYNEEGEVVG